MRIRGARTRSYLFVFIVCSSFGWAQQPTVNRDTQIPVQLLTAIVTTKVSPGEELEFQTTAGVLIGNGIVVPRGARVLGHVEQVRSGSAAKNAALRISIDRLDWHRWSAPLNAVVVSVEPSDAEDNPIWRHLHRAVVGRRTMLEHIAVRSHLSRQAFVDFESDRGDFTVRQGVRLVLWQIDAERDPVKYARNPILEVRSADK
jgi:hypothetical protein